MNKLLRESRAVRRATDAATDAAAASFFFSGK
jgi:hypothetical protein